MKKLFLIGVLLLIGLSLFAQSSVRDYNGYDWQNWTSMEQEKFITGYFVGFDTFRVFIEDMPEPPDNNLKEFLISLYNWATFPGNVGDMMKILDRWYSDPEFLEFPIYEVILVAYEKDWWIEE